jgi:hypothetical protein
VADDNSRLIRGIAWATPIVTVKPRLLVRFETRVRCGFLLVTDLEDERADHGGENHGYRHHKNDANHW